VAKSRPATSEHRGCVGRPVGDDGGSGCDSVARAASGSRAHVMRLAWAASSSSACAAAAVLVEVASMAAGAPRHRGR
jgi:hypothetical protein